LLEVNAQRFPQAPQGKVNLEGAFWILFANVAKVY